ncbi:unnamed protein product [Eruca vesicaria subsp. sativa]|uniref:Uncharacterized protein n=1 Tax=Eruca vesicaria subsp. sativa TaxID=29727 RepID=A0ABC8KQ43_ERUVS|nr:unnamed protein product [Eruca vesicaria subsp. sativa]
MNFIVLLEFVLVMDSELPKRLFIAGSKPEVSHINNYCRLGILDKLKSRFKMSMRKWRGILCFLRFWRFIATT